MNGIRETVDFRLLILHRKAGKGHRRKRLERDYWEYFRINNVVWLFAANKESEEDRRLDAA